MAFTLVVAILFIAGSCKQQAKKTEHVSGKETSNIASAPEWSKNANIYEVNIRQYTPEGTFKAFESHLPRLKNMGVNILWFMPIHPIGEKNRKGSLGSYYAVKDYKAVNPEFGTLKDFKSLVKTAHDMGFKVILDWVANHTSWDNQWIYDHPEWYSKDSLGQMIAPFDWTDVADLNYDSKPLWDAMIDALKFWVTEADIDGYRCDVAGMVPTEFWERARKELDEIKPVFMLAEAEQADHHKSAFDMSYAWELHHIFNEIAKGKKTGDDLENYFVKNDSVYPSSAFRMTFITNHDENSWNGTVMERMGKTGLTFAMLSYTLPGMPLIYSGQEVGLNKRLEFFEKDKINWDYSSP
ncbi:MAG: alpha-amylase, partial [Bacteroidales bacterium]|nr:alpha-amylase [Bacteroidales bacterium]